MATRPLYKRNIFVLWFGSFFAGIGISLINPFIPLFIETLGEFNRQELAFYSGIIIAAPYLMQALVSPFWGRLADRKGRKIMLLRASLGMSVFTIVASFSFNAWFLLAARMLFGSFSGFMSNAVALLAVQIPKEEAGKVMGSLNAANIGGMLIGPVFGGIALSFVGYREVFIITGCIFAVVFLLTLLFIGEDFTPIKKGETIPIKEALRMVGNTRVVIGVFITTLMITLTNSSMNPVLPLYVREILPEGGNVEFWTGIVSAAPGITTIFVASLLGSLGDRIGMHKVLMFGLALQVLVFIPMVYVTAIWQFVVLRLILGIANASLLPGVQTILTRSTPKEATSRVFSLNQSFQSVGMVLGPLVGAAISGLLDLHFVFFATAAFALANLLNIVRIRPSRFNKDTEKTV